MGDSSYVERKKERKKPWKDKDDEGGFLRKKKSRRSVGLLSSKPSSRWHFVVVVVDVAFIRNSFHLIWIEFSFQFCLGLVCLNVDRQRLIEFKRKSVIRSRAATFSPFLTFRLPEANVKSGRDRDRKAKIWNATSETTTTMSLNLLVIAWESVIRSLRYARRVSYRVGSFPLRLPLLLTFHQTEKG